MTEPCLGAVRLAERPADDDVPINLLLVCSFSRMLLPDACLNVTSYQPMPECNVALLHANFNCFICCGVVIGFEHYFFIAHTYL